MNFFLITIINDEVCLGVVERGGGIEEGCVHFYPVYMTCYSTNIAEYKYK